MSIEVNRRLWTVEEYNRMGQLGLLGPKDRVELIDGEVLRLSPQNPPHATVTSLLTNLLVRAFGGTHIVRVQLPWEASSYSEPEPDFVLLPREKIFSAKRHPTEADLVIEVADSSLAFDRSRKSRLYAESGVPEYWVVNLPQRCLEVYRQPKEQVYTETFTLTANDSVAPLVIPGDPLSVAEFLPPELDELSTT